MAKGSWLSRNSLWIAPLFTMVATYVGHWLYTRPPSVERNVEINERCYVLDQTACADGDYARQGNKFMVQCKPYRDAPVEDKNYWYVVVQDCAPGICRNNRCGGR